MWCPIAQTAYGEEGIRTGGVAEDPAGGLGCERGERGIVNPTAFRQVVKPEAVESWRSWTPALLRPSEIVPEEDLRALVNACDATRDETTSRAEKARRDRESCWEALPLSSDFFAAAARQVHGFTAPDPKDPVVAKRQALPFYSGAYLVEITDRRAVRPLRSRFVQCTGGPALATSEVIPINWMSKRLHDLSDERSLQLKAAEVASYLCFFGENLGASGKIFKIVETDDDLPFVGSGVEYKKQVAECARPAYVWNRNPIKVRGLRAFLVDANVAWADAMFHSAFLVWTNGEVRMITDAPPMVLSLRTGALDLRNSTHYVYLREKVFQ